MENENCKLFIGGISWDTDEDRLREHFQTYGEVIESLIMKDKITGRPRGFGFIVFADPNVAEMVVKQKHLIDGRNVEAKIAVPKEDQLSINRSNGSNHSSPSPMRTKKIFVGGLASTVTESEFKTYFDQYGTITDVVVMYDHNTKRPRGFGFITFDSEEAVDRVLVNTFHELSGKMVEVKRAVPKELSPGPTRSLVGIQGLNRFGSILDAYSLGYSPSGVGGYGMNMNGRFSPVSVGRSGYLQYGTSNYPMDSILSSDYIRSGNLHPNLRDYGARPASPIQSVYSNRYSSPVGYNTGINVSGGRNMWLNGNLSYDTKPSNPNQFIGPRDVNTEFLGGFGNIGTMLGSSSNFGQDGGTSSYNRVNVNYGLGKDNFMAREVESGKINGSNVRGPASFLWNDNPDRSFGNLWQSSPTEMVNSGGNISYRDGNAASNVTSSNFSGYMGGYNAGGSYGGNAA